MGGSIKGVTNSVLRYIRAKGVLAVGFFESCGVDVYNGEKVFQGKSLGGRGLPGRVLLGLRGKRGK